MFNSPYAVEVLTAQHRRDLQASADRTRLVRHATPKQQPRRQPPAQRATRRWSLWPSRHHTARTAANPT